jgi:hypothetical protein
LFLTLLSSEVPFSWKIIHVSKSIIWVQQFMPFKRISR